MGADLSKKEKAMQEESETQKLDSKKDGDGTHSYGSTGAEDGGDGGEGAPMSRSESKSSVYRRLSRTPSTDQPFERSISRVYSGKSLRSAASSYASIRTRLTSISRCEYHDNLKTDLQSGLTGKLIFTAFIIAFGNSFQFGYNIGVLNQPNQLIKDFYNATYTERFGEISEGTVTVLWSLTNAIFIPGGMIGAFLGGYIADKLGRKRSILFSHIFALLGAGIASACVVAKAPSMLMVGRFLFGINSGLSNCIAPMYLSEICPFNLRGAFGTVHQLSVTMGIFLSSVFGLNSLLGTTTLWPFLMLLEAIPALTSLLILPFLPETPRYLLLVKGQRDAARKALKFYRNSDDVNTDMEEMDTEAQQQIDAADKKKAEGGDSAEQDSYTWGRLLTEKALRMPLFIACGLQVVQQFSGINAIFFYSSGIFENAGVQKVHIPYAVIGTNAVNVAMTVVCVPLMDIAGRRLLLLIPMVAMCVDLVIITIALNLQAQFFWMSVISVICVIVYVICFAVGLGPIPMMIGAELFRQGPRPLAMAAAGVTNWVFTFIVAMAFESIQAGMGNFTFLLFLAMMLAFVAFIYFIVPETKNKTFEEIAHQFAPGDELEVEEIMDDVFDDIPEANEADDHPDSHLVTFNVKNSPDGNKESGNDIPLKTI